jgi:GDSL-like Lipase/Acylhydrolase family
MSGHIVLLGDSILDNAAYVPGRRPAVIDQVRNRLPPGWSATLLAVDGSVIDDVYRQLDRLPPDASHLVLSVGGNDLLAEIGILQESVRTVGDGLRLLGEVRDRFESEYERLLSAIAGKRLRTAVCTIYNPCSPDEAFQRAAIVAVAIFNDRIIQAARKFGVPLIELRAVCTEIAHYANEIEPSAAGGARIAEAIVDLVTERYDGERSFLLPGTSP